VVGGGVGGGGGRAKGGAAAPEAAPDEHVGHNLNYSTLLITQKTDYLFYFVNIF